MSALVAHQGGWDEILLVAGPILAIIGLLALAKRRVDDQLGEHHDGSSGGSGDESRDGSGGASEPSEEI